MRIPEYDLYGRVSDRVDNRRDYVLYIRSDGKRKWHNLPIKEIAKGLWDGCRVEAYRGETVEMRRIISSGYIPKWVKVRDDWRGEIVKQ